MSQNQNLVRFTCTLVNLKVLNTNLTLVKILKILYLKHKFGEICSKIKFSLHLYENWRTSQFEDSEQKYDMIKGFLNSNPDWGNIRPVFKLWET